MKTTEIGFVASLLLAATIIWLLSKCDTLAMLLDEGYSDDYH